MKMPRQKVFDVISQSSKYHRARFCRSVSTQSSSGEEPLTTHFGYQEVKVEEKKGKVAEVFHGVANSYDLMNDAMSVGIHRLWKDAFVDLIQPSAHRDEPLHCLDVAGGTGDIAFRIAKELKQTCFNLKTSAGEQDSIVVCDINSSMLQVGEDRANMNGMGNGHPKLTWTQGDAEKLPFDSDSFDLYTIAFGIRNVTDIDQALREAHRVLKKGGRFMCLEFSHVEHPILKTIYDTYSFNVIPSLGQLLANDRASYQYLVESIRQFPTQEVFQSKIQTAGFQSVKYMNYNGGIVAVHSGFKL